MHPIHPDFHPVQHSDPDQGKCLTALEIAYKLAEPSKFLIVDDDLSACDLLQSCLAYIGCDSDSVMRGDSAIDALCKRRYSGVFLDMRMPGMSGQDVLSQMQCLNLHLPVIIVTGYPSDVTRELMDFGVLALILKPFTIETLTATIARYCSIFKIRHLMPGK